MEANTPLKHPIGISVGFAPLKLSRGAGYLERERQGDRLQGEQKVNIANPEIAGREQSGFEIAG